MERAHGFFLLYSNFYFKREVNPKTKESILCGLMWFKTKTTQTLTFVFSEKGSFVNYTTFFFVEYTITLGLTCALRILPFNTHPHMMSIKKTLSSLTLFL